jgi:hypothetical protein
MTMSRFEENAAGFVSTLTMSSNFVIAQVHRIFFAQAFEIRPLFVVFVEIGQAHIDFGERQTPCLGLCAHRAGCDGHFEFL